MVPSSVASTASVWPKEDPGAAHPRASFLDVEVLPQPSFRWKLILSVPSILSPRTDCPAFVKLELGVSFYSKML